MTYDLHMSAACDESHLHVMHNSYDFHAAQKPYKITLNTQCNYPHSAAYVAHYGDNYMHDLVNAHQSVPLANNSLLSSTNYSHDAA